MSMQYVELGDGRQHPVGGFAVLRHVVQRITNGKGSKGRAILTECGEAVAFDDAVMIQHRTSSVGARGVLPMCKDCCGETGHAPIFDEDHIHQDAEEPGVLGDKCNLLPPSNGESNQACTLPNRHTNAHQNGRISWSGADKSYSMLGPQERQLAQNRQLGEEIAATYNGDGPLGKKPAKKKSNGIVHNAPPVEVAPLRLEQLAVDDIERSPLNHRTRFEGIEELGETVAAERKAAAPAAKKSPAKKKGRKS